MAPEVDILINNAGSLVKRAGLTEFSEELFNEVMDLNFRSAWCISQDVVPSMESKGWGVIVNLSSIAARNGGGPGATIYAAAKAAVACATKGMAKELAPKGIRVNSILPGWTRSSLTEGLQTWDKFNDQVISRAPVGRWANGDDFSAIAVYLASDHSSFHVGDSIVIDGGYTVF